MLNEDEENATIGKQQVSVQTETTVVPATMEVGVENEHQSPLLLRSRKKEGK